VDAQKIDFDGGEGTISDANCDWDTGDEGAEFALIVVSCAETNVPLLLIVRCQ
jgi:hypothetical protein